MGLKELREALAKRKKERKELRGEIDKLLAEIRGIDPEKKDEIEQAEAKCDELFKRTAECDEKIEGLEAEIEREERISSVRSGRVPTRSIEGRRNRQERGIDFDGMTPEQVRATEEYRSAWLRSIAVDERGNHIFGEMSEVEKRAYTYTTTAAASVVPTITQNRIVDLVRAEAPMLDDATVTQITEGFAIPVRSAIAEGDAAVVAESAANDDEKDTFTLITMTGVDIKKHVVMTRRMRFQSIDAFEDWLVGDISKRIMVAKERVILARLDGSAPASGISANNDVKIASANIVPSAAYTDASIRSIMALLEEPGQVICYANRYTIFNGLAGIVDGAGNKAFINTPQDDPTVKGVIYGAKVKEDVNLANNVAYFGVKGAVKANDFVPLEVFPTVEAKTANTIFTGTEVFDAGLENPKAFAKATFTEESE